VNHWTLRLTLTLLVAALTLTAPLALFSLRRIARRTLSTAVNDAAPRTDRDELHSLVPVCVPLMIMGGLSFAAAQADLWIAGTLATGNDVALYAAARRLVVMVAMPLQMVNLTVMSSVPALYFQGRKVELQRLLRLAASISRYQRWSVWQSCFFNPRKCWVYSSNLFIGVPPVTWSSCCRPAGVGIGRQLRNYSFNDGPSQDCFAH